MLVLSRRESESLVIDGRIVVTVVKLASGKARLGIEAPPDVAIKREELLSQPNLGLKQAGVDCFALATCGLAD